MKPLVTSRPITDYTPKRQKELCLCNVRCDNIMLIVRDEFAYQVCEKGTAAFAYELLKEASRIADPTELKPNHWSPLQIVQLKEYVLSVGNEIPYGGYSLFAKQIGKTREQVKDKVSALRKLGELPPLTKSITGDVGKK
jgi:hypothetical protein